MEFNFVTNEDNFNFNDFKNDISLIEKSEVVIWELHNNEKIIDLYNENKNRNNKINELVLIYKNSNKRFELIEKEIIEKYPEIESVNFKNHFNKINILMDELLRVVNFQKEKLMITDNLIDKNIRTEILNGNKKFEYESQFTSTVKEIFNVINNEELIVNNDDENKEIKIEVNDDNKNEILNNNDKEKISDEEKEKNLINEIDKLDANIKVEKNEINKEEVENKEKIVESLEVIKPIEENNLSEVSNKELDNFQIKDEIKTEPTSEELTNIIKEYFSYNDSPELNDEEKEKILKSAMNSNSALKYARIIWKLKKEGKLNEVEEIAQKIYGNVLTDLHNYEIGIEPYSLSQSWAIWDVIKQIYYLEHPSETDRKRYTLANPVYDEEKQIEIQDRHIGLEIYSKMTTGKLDKFLNKIQDPIYRKRMVEFMIKKPNQNGTLSSDKLAELGKNVRLGFNL